MSLQNRWKKGESGNPSGRPKSPFSFKRELEAKLSEVNPNDRVLQRTYGRMIIDKAVSLALRGQGNIRAISEILDRYVGRPAQQVDLNATILTREEYVKRIEEALAVLPTEDNELKRPGDTRIN